MTITIPVYIEWNIDPAHFPYKQWFYTPDEPTDSEEDSQNAEKWENAWDIQLRITRKVEGSWNTYGELKLLQSNLPEALMEPEAAFVLWNGYALATVSLVSENSVWDGPSKNKDYEWKYTKSIRRNAVSY